MKNIFNKQNLYPYFIIVSSALLFMFAYPPFSMWFFVIPAIALFLHGIDLAKNKIMSGTVFGTVIVMLLCPWIFTAMFYYYDLGIFKSFGFYVAISFIPGLTFGVFSFFIKSFLEKLKTEMNFPREIFALVLIASFFVMIEWLRGAIYSQHDWAHTATVFYLNPKYLYITRFTGASGLTFFSVISSGFFWMAIKKLRVGDKKFSIIYIALIFSVFIPVYLLGWINIDSGNAQVSRMDGGKEFRIEGAIIHSGINQTKRWKSKYHTDNLAAFTTMSLDSFKDKENKKNDKSNTRIILWPETALTFSLQSNEKAIAAIKRITREKKSWLITGTPSYRGSGAGRKFYNSVFIFSSDGEKVGQYDKIDLLPFAEESLFGINITARSDGSLYHRGELPGVITINDSIKNRKFRAGLVVCFEVGNSAIVSRLVKNNIQLLINISNDAWFGNSSESIQQLSLLVLRSAEYGIPSIRTSGYGVAAFVDSYGRIGEKSNIEANSIIEDSVTIFPVQRTFFSRYKDWFVILCGIMILIYYIAENKIFESKSYE